MAAFDHANILEKMPNLAVLTMTGNPVISKISMYRKTMVARLKALTYLDDRPVFAEERRTTDAWFEGGPEAEEEMRQKIRDEKREYDRRNFEGRKRKRRKFELKSCSNSIRATHAWLRLFGRQCQ